MKQLIFTKYSNERNRSFAIRTDILQDEQGHRFVRKVPLYEEGKQHIFNISRMSEKLQELYQGSRLCCNQCVYREDELWLEYVEASTLEEKMDLLLAQGKTEETWQLFSGYLRQIQEINSIETFHITEEFKKVFGINEIPGNHRCAPVSDIDLVCSNIMLRDSQWMVLDYEWSFEFPVPVSYLLYRIIHYYVETRELRQALAQYRPYEWIGITEEERAVYQEMEANFQRYLTSGHVPMREMYGDISPGVYPVQHLVRKEEIRRGEERLQIFYSFGSGFEEKNSRYYKMPGGYLKMKFDIPEGTQELRIDPGDAPGICRIHSMKFDVGELGITGFSEGMEPYENGYLMNCFDPKIYLGKVPEDARQLEVEMQICPVEPESVEICTANFELRKKSSEQYRNENERLRNEKKMQDETIRILKEQIAGQEKRLEEQKRLILQMRGTKVWKLYEQYRKIVERK